MSTTRPPAPAPSPFAPLLAQMERLLGEDLPAAHHLGPRDSGGRLEQTDWGFLLGGAYQRGFTGGLTLADGPGGPATIWFEAGRPSDVVLSGTSPAERASASPATVERWFFALAGLTAGRFEWAASAGAPAAHRTHLLRHPAALVLETLLRRGPESLRRWLGSDANHLRLKLDPVSLAVVESAIEDVTLAGALRLFDGTRSFRDVARGSQQDEDVVLRSAFVLFCFGALEFADVDFESVAPGLGPTRPQADRARLAALFALAEQSDYFTFLGIDPTASATEVAASARRLAHELDETNLHPDVALATGRERGVILHVLSEATRILGDADLRARYREAFGPAAGAAPVVGNFPSSKTQP